MPVTGNKNADAAAKLTKLAEELRNGGNFPITRLTVLKRCCTDPTVAAGFALHLISRAKDTAPRRFQPLIANAARELRKYRKDPTGARATATLSALHALEQAQPERRRTRWGDVRTIESRETLLAEYALRCITRPYESAYWGYHLARQYAERYDPRYGTGLIPASADAVADMAAHWSRQAAKSKPSAVKQRK